MESHQVIRDRLRHELDRNRLTAVQLARNAGVKTSFIYDILNGKSTNPSTVKLAMVAESLGINLSYLAGSAEHPHLGGINLSSQSDLVAIPHLAAQGTEAKARKSEPYCYFRRAWIRDTLSASPNDLRAVTLAGATMQPTLCDKDLVLVDTRQTSPSPPGIFVLSDGFGLVAKRLEYASSAKPPVVRVISDNPQYGAYERSASQIQIIGRVVWLARQL